MSENVSSWRDEISPFVRGYPSSLIDEKVLDVCRDFCRRTRSWRKDLTAIDVVALTATDIAMVNGSPSTITCTSSDFTDVDGEGTTFVAGQTLVIDNTDDNEKNVTIASAGVAANTLTLESRDVLIDESAGNSVVLSACDYALTSSDGNISEVLWVKHDDIYLKPISEEYLDREEPGWRERVSADPTHYFVTQDRRLRLVYAPSEELIAGLKVNVALMPLRTATTVEDFIYDDYKDIITYGVLAKLLAIPQRSFTDLNDALKYGQMYIYGWKRAFYDAQNGYTKADSGGITA